MQRNANEQRNTKTNKTKQRQTTKQIGQQKRTDQTNQSTNQPTNHSVSQPRSNWQTLSNFHRKIPRGCDDEPIKLKGGFGGFTA